MLCHCLKACLFLHRPEASRCDVSRCGDQNSDGSCCDFIICRPHRGGLCSHHPKRCVCVRVRVRACVRAYTVKIHLIATFWGFVVRIDKKYIYKCVILIMYAPSSTITQFQNNTISCIYQKCQAISNLICVYNKIDNR